MSRTIHIFSSTDEMQCEAARAIVQTLRRAVEQRMVASFVLSGGSTPRAIYALLGAREMRSALPWERVHVFFGDERYVSHDHPDSNYRMAYDALLSHLSVPVEHVHRIETAFPPREAAERYEQELQRAFALKQHERPRFDLVLLGLGDDGHTASFFPETDILNEQHRLVREVYVPKLQTYRISLTLPVFNNARDVFFLVSGSTKAEIVAKVVEGEEGQFPAQAIRPTHGTVRWFLDHHAAALLRFRHRQEAGTAS
ncbi:MAG: 6-phosphogluconolactonase [Ignavibacteria bacterium]